jgi:hypothetical protein
MCHHMVKAPIIAKVLFLKINQTNMAQAERAEQSLRPFLFGLDKDPKRVSHTELNTSVYNCLGKNGHRSGIEPGNIQPAVTNHVNPMVKSQSFYLFRCCAKA